MTLASPYSLLLLLPLAALAVRRWRQERPTLPFVYATWLRPASHDATSAAPSDARARYLRLPDLLLIAGLALAILAHARPMRQVMREVRAEGLRIVFCLDVSSSMAEKDMDATRDRLAVAKAEILRFLQQRPNDRVALILFARFPDLVCPLTTDHEAFRERLEAAQGMRKDGPEDATGIGAALARAALAFSSEGEGEANGDRFVVLLTDGEENVATSRNPYEIAPTHGGQLLRTLKLPVFGIALGSGMTNVRGQEIPLDTAPMRSVCDQTGGLFARAEDAQSLSRVYEQIQTLKPSPRTRTEVEFLTYERPILLLAALLVAAAIGLRATILRVIPAC